MAKKKKKEVQLTREQALAVAKSARANAESLRRAALLLDHAQLHGHAAALAVLGVEEAAKSFESYGSVLLGGSRPGMWTALFRDHGAKHAAAWKAEFCQRAVEPIAQFGARCGSRTERRFPGMPENVRGYLALFWAGRVIHRIIGSHPTLVMRLFNEHVLTSNSEVGERSLDSLKMSGLYVDVDHSGQVHAPSDLESSAAQRPLESIGAVLTAVDLFVHALELEVHLPKHAEPVDPDIVQAWLLQQPDPERAVRLLTRHMPPSFGVSVDRQRS